MGPLEVRIDGGEPLVLGGSRQRALLAVLMLRANELAAMDLLVDELWGERAPTTAVHTVQVFVSRLRRALGPAGERLLTAAPGYVLRVEPDDAFAQAAIARLEELRVSCREELVEAHLALGRHAEDGRETTCPTPTQPVDMSCSRDPPGTGCVGTDSSTPIHSGSYGPTGR